MTLYTAALVGTGRIGFTLGFDKKREQPASHTMALLKNKQIRLIAGADTDSERLARWQKHVPHAQVFATSDELYAAVHPDIITIAVNEDAHLAECLKAIRAKPRLVILEKPVALNVEQALKIKTCAEENGVPVMVNHERRFARDYNIAANFINRIGDLQMIRADLFSGLRVYSKEKESTGEYSLLHDGTHLVDIVQFLLGSYRQNATEAPEATAPQATPTTPATDIGDTPHPVRMFHIRPGPQHQRFNHRQPAVDRGDDQSQALSAFLFPAEKNDQHHQQQAHLAAEKAQC